MSLLLLFAPQSGGSPPPPPTPVETVAELPAGGGAGDWAPHLLRRRIRQEQEIAIDDEELVTLAAMFLSKNRH